MDGAEDVKAEHVSNSDSDFGNGERSPGNDGMAHLKRFSPPNNALTDTYHPPGIRQHAC